MKAPTVLPGTGWHVVHGRTERPVVAIVVVDPIAATGFLLVADGAGFMRADHLGCQFDLVHESELTDEVSPYDYNPTEEDG